MRQYVAEDQTGEELIITEGPGFLTIRDQENRNATISSRDCVEVIQ